MKLWKSDLNKEIERFTVGKDHVLDERLVFFDCLASKAHAQMLQKAKVLTQNECTKIRKCLDEIIKLDEEDKFKIKVSDEDCHTAIENYLTKKLGDTGKKIHTARSRNDQVLTALRLYEKEAMNSLELALDEFVKTLKETLRKQGKTQIPGFTHMRKAMPITIGTWLESFLEASQDDKKQLESLKDLIDQSPLGTAAGFGVPIIKIYRGFTAKALRFKKVQKNPLYAQLSRGKFECSILHNCGQILFNLNRLASDLILFSMENFGFISLPEKYCTGSSIMPHKKNPDVLELVRANYHVVTAEYTKIRGITGNLISGYHRDLQLTKEPLFNGLDITHACLRIMTLVLSGITVNESQCSAALTEELFATEEVYKLVKQGIPFRTAYQKIAAKYSKTEK